MGRALMRTILARIVAVCAFCALFCWPSQASAHAIGLSRGIYQATDEGLDATLVLARAELDFLLPSLDRDQNGSVEPRELALAHAELERWFVANLEVTSGGARCPGALERALSTERDGLRLELRYQCPRNGAAEASVRLGFLNQLARGHRHAAHVMAGKAARDEIYYGDHSRLAVSRAATPAPSSKAGHLLGFLRMGFEHILTGYDHVVFLLALLLTARRLQSLLWVITAFTLGHSLSLALVVFGLISAPSSLVEPAIALSVAWVGAENLLRNREVAVDRRWRMTLPFGLLHGLGFAGALTEASVPHAELPAALLGFNLGVELGQLALVALCLPLVLRFGRAHWFMGRAVPAVSLAVVVAGLGWFVARVS